MLDINIKKKEIEGIEISGRKVRGEKKQKAGLKGG